LKGACFGEGAGGGIVFIPAFTAMGIAQAESVGTSLVIQCCGMTTGALAWLLRFQNRPAIYQRYQHFMKRTILLVGSASIVGVLLGEYWIASMLTFSMESIFALLSIGFGIIILTLTFLPSNQYMARTRTTWVEHILFVIMGLIGGIVTSVMSIGIGEILLMLLFLRCFPIQISIFMAVAISSLTVLVAAPYFITSNAVVWGVVAFAAPAAILGALMGRALTEKLGAVRVKVLCALWILLTGIVM